MLGSQHGPGLKFGPFASSQTQLCTMPSPRIVTKRALIDDTASEGSDTEESERSSSAEQGDTEVLGTEDTSTSSSSQEEEGEDSLGGFIVSDGEEDNEEAKEAVAKFLAECRQRKRPRVALAPSPESEQHA